MHLHETLRAAGMTPPHSIAPGRWVRFPGIGKGKANRAGWCRLITPTLAIFGDWSTGLSATWHDDNHIDTAESRQLLQEARERERQFLAEQRQRQAQAASAAEGLIKTACLQEHPYLYRKGFGDRRGLVSNGKLLIPIRDSQDYARVISVQEIDEQGEKRFLTGSRTRGGIHRIGAPSAKCSVLCEGYATGLSLDAALSLISPSHAVVVCFSATNLVVVAERFPKAVVAADNDRSATGEEAAKRTGLKWTMPYEVGTDFNDLHQAMGLYVVVQRMRELLN